MAELRGDPARLQRERRLVAAAITLVVFVRSAVFVFWPQSFFDSDQAITGLMAKHLAELRAFPVFYYGQSYMLAVEAWVAAPFILVFGSTVTALRLPLLGINIAVALLLLRMLERDAGLRPALAAIPALFFALPAPGTTSHLLEANGGTVEPFLYVLLLWLTRARPNWGGVILGVGFLQREFTLYGLVALLAVEAMRGVLFTRDGLIRRLIMLRAAAEVWLLVQWLKWYSSAAGPATTMGDVYRPRDNVFELVNRICWDAGTIPRGLWRLATEHWPVLFGTRPLPLNDFSIDSTVHQGLPGGWMLLAAAAVIAVASIARRLLADRRWSPRDEVCVYLTLSGAFSALAYVLARCGEIDFVIMRYELLSIFCAAGLGAWFLRIEPSRSVRRTWMGLVFALTLIAAVAHVRLLTEYLTNPPVGAKQLIVRNLEARGARYAIADYWLAYSITFLSRERIITGSSDFIRIREYERVIADHRSEAVRVSRTSCEGGRLVIPGIYFCPN